MDSRIKKNPEHIFECYVEYIRHSDNEEPEMKRLFPKDYQFDEDLKRNLPKFVFPIEVPNTGDEEHFTFCLTDLESKFRFGFVRYPVRGNVCSCFLSDLPWFKVFYKMLDKLAEMRMNHQIELIDPFLSSLYKHKVPSLSSETIISVVPEMHTGQVFTFPLPNPKRLPEIPSDYNLTAFYPSLHHEIILCLFANMLFERRIIITSSSLTTLSATVHGSVLLLYPLFWQHIFIPIMPPHLIDYCTAPMPFMIGVHSSMMDKVRQMPINDAVILDMDKSELESPYYDDLLQIPTEILSQLKHVIKKDNSAYGDTASKAFLQANVAMLGGYRSALKMREGQSEVTFDEETFLKSRGPQMSEFLIHLLQFQHFQQFLAGRIERLASNKERDLFDEEVIAYGDDLKSVKIQSEQVLVTLKEIRDVIHRGGKKMKSNTRTLMRDTKILFGRNNDRIGPGDYNTLQSSPGLTSKSATLEGRPRPKEPPPVIPYKDHVIGMKKLHDTIQEQNKRLSIFDSVPVYVIPPNSVLQKLEIDEHGESESLSSKESVEAVVTGQLVDISDESSHLDRVPTPAAKQNSDEGDTDSASIISSSSSSSGSFSGLHMDVIKNDSFVMESTSPPVAPPRRKKQAGRTLSSKNGTASSLPQIEMHELGSRNSPVSDFGSSIADTLIDHSRRCSNPISADLMSTTGEELYRQLKDVPFTNSTSMPVMTPQNNNTTDMSTSSIAMDMRHLDSIKEGVVDLNQNDPWKPINSSKSPGGVRKAPPIKPQPYSGSGFKFFENSYTILTPVDVSNVSSKDTPPPPSDPLADIFGKDGLHGYAMKSNTKAS